MAGQRMSQPAYDLTAISTRCSRHNSAPSDVVAEPRRVPHCRADLRPQVLGSADVAVRTRLPGRALVAGGSERGAVERYGRTGAGWELGWEFLAGHAAGNDGNYRRV